MGRAIRRIEEDLGLSLVRRMARGQSLTEPGRLLANLAAPHIAALRDVTAAAGREASEAYGLLRITTPEDIGALVLGPLVPGFLARYPRIRLEVEHTLRLVDIVGEGFDLALRVLRPDGPRIKGTRTLSTECLVSEARVLFWAARPEKHPAGWLAAHMRLRCTQTAGGEAK